MYNGQTVSLKTILWRVMNNPIVEGITYERAAELVTDAIKLLGAPLTFQNVTTNPPLLIVDHKLTLPENLVTIRGARYIPDLDNYSSFSEALTYATNIYHTSEVCEENIDSASPLELTYEVSSGVMTTSFSEGYIQIAYKALPVDEDGYPLVPDNEKFKQALEYYVMFKFLEPLWTMGKVTDKVFEYYNQKKCFYMGAAGNAVTLAGIPHLEAIVNSVNRLILNTNAHKNFFALDGKKEQIKRYN